MVYSILVEAHRRMMFVMIGPFRSTLIMAFQKYTHHGLLIHTCQMFELSIPMGDHCKVSLLKIHWWFVCHQINQNNTAKPFYLMGLWICQLLSSGSVLQCSGNLWFRFFVLRNSNKESIVLLPHFGIPLYMIRRSHRSQCFHIFHWYDRLYGGI